MSVIKKRTTFDYVNIIILVLIAITMIYPFYYILIISFNDGLDTMKGGVYLAPRMFTLANFKALLSQGKWLHALFVTIMRTMVGTFTGVLFTSLVAYALSYKELLFRKTYIVIVLIAMYIPCPIITNYILLKELSLLNRFWVYIVPNMFDIFLLLIAISFMKEIPAGLSESARIDGAGEFKIFFKIIMPVSKPLIATMTLFIAVGQWNAWVDSAYYVKDDNLRTITYRMIEMINAFSAPQTDTVTAQYSGDAMGLTSKSLQMASIIITITPILCIYPFLQKHFVKGVMIGSVKE